MKTTRDIINDSGYPLQLHLESEIKNTRNRHSWRVLATEHRWVNAETHDEGFIDLVLDHEHSDVKLVVECKRIIGSWTFLLPQMNPVPTKHAKILRAQYDPYSLMWMDHSKVEPESYQSAFCVMEVDGKKDSRTLEKLAGEVLLSLEYLAQEEMELYKSSPPDPAGGRFLPHKMSYLPIIVTTAKLQKYIFDPNSVSIDDGKFSTDQAIDEVPLIRFRKNLATDLQYERPNITDIQTSNSENDRTVFVVQAKHFVEFLTLVPGR